MILADSEIEIVPPEIARLPAIRKDAERRGKRAEEMLLDSSLHHSAMRGLDRWERRGRPDIVHMSMLIANESILNREGMLDTVIHTRNDEVIKISPEMRVVKNYVRFRGLMEQLFMKGEVPVGNPLMRLEKGNVKAVLEEMDVDKVVLLSESGGEKNLEDVLTEHTACIIGGFPHGDFISPVKEIADEVVSIYPSPLPAWIALTETVVSYERKFMTRYL